MICILASSECKSAWSLLTLADPPEQQNRKSPSVQEKVCKIDECHKRNECYPWKYCTCDEDGECDMYAGGCQTDMDCQWNVRYCTAYKEKAKDDLLIGPCACVKWDETSR